MLTNMPDARLRAKKKIIREKTPQRKEEKNGKKRERKAAEEGRGTREKRNI